MYHGVRDRHDDNRSDITDDAREKTGRKNKEDENHAQERHIDGDVLGESRNDTGEHAFLGDTVQFSHAASITNRSSETIDDVFALDRNFPSHALGVAIELGIGIEADGFRDHLEEWNVALRIPHPDRVR